MGPGWATTLATVADVMRQPLIYGLNNGKSTVSLNGIAYLQGWDTWSELGTLFAFANSQVGWVVLFLF